MIWLTHVLCKAKAKYTLRGGEKINLLFMDCMQRLKVKSKGIVSTAEVFSQDIRLEFSIKKSGVIIMNRGKVRSRNGIELPS